MTQEVIPPGKSGHPANDRRNSVVRLVFFGAVIGAVAALVYALVKKMSESSKK